MNEQINEWIQIIVKYTCVNYTIIIQMHMINNAVQKHPELIIFVIDSELHVGGHAAYNTLI